MVRRIMYSTAHKMFSVGIATTLAFFLRLHIISTLFVIFMAPIMGTFPDIDIKLNQMYGLGVKHRGFTHHPLFIVLFAIVMSMSIFFIEGLFEIFTGLSWATGLYPHVILKFVPVPNFDNFFSSELVMIFFCMLAAGLSHLVLDIPTYMGIDLMGEHYEGSMRSAGTGNLFFIMLGIALTIIGTIGNLSINLMHSASISEEFVYIICIMFIVISFVVVIASIIIRKRKNVKQLYCGTIDTQSGEVGICSPSRCISIDDHDACFDDDLSF